MIVATELPENENTSITNVVEYLVPEVLARHLPHRFEEAEPVVWIEHYPRTEEDRRRGLPAYSRALFPSWAPRIETVRGATRPRLGEPEWRHLPDAAVAALIGPDEAGLPPASTR